MSIMHDPVKGRERPPDRSRRFARWKRRFVRIAFPVAAGLILWGIKGVIVLAWVMIRH